MAIHKKLSKKSRTDLGTDLNDYDMAFLPTPTDGPFECGEEFHNIYGLEYFSAPRLRGIWKSFRKKMIRDIGEDSFEKIERGLRCYVVSSRSIENDLLILKKSISVWRPNLLNEFRNDLSEIETQHLKPLDIEDLNRPEFSRIMNNDLIPSEHLQQYQTLATQTSLKYLQEYAEYCDRERSGLIQKLEDISFFRGYNNRNYYNKTDRGPDILSHYSSSTEQEKEIFFERSLFTSYSICWKTAEMFMVAFSSRRRVSAETNLKSIENRIFSSFVVSPSFYKNQFEFLILPSSAPLLIFKEYDNGEMASFKILGRS